MPRSDRVKEFSDPTSSDDDPATEPTLEDGYLGGMPAVEGGGAQQIGVGAMPRELVRFNWGAFFLPALWGVVYNVWLVVALWFLATFAPLFLGIVFGVAGSDGSVAIPSLIGITVVSDAFLAYVRLWTGASANQLYWDRESRRLAANPEAAPRTDVAHFSARQRRWVVWGALGLGVAMAFTLVTNYATLKPYGLGWAFVAEPIVFLAAEMALGVWLAGKMRAELPEPGAASEADTE